METVFIAIAMLCQVNSGADNRVVVNMIAESQKACQAKLAKCVLDSKRSWNNALLECVSQGKH